MGVDEIMYERILEAIQQLREQGVRPSVIYMKIDCYKECKERLHCFEEMGLEVRILPLFFASGNKYWCDDFDREYIIE